MVDMTKIFPFADLHGANLRGADLHGADLHEANLRGADLCGADLLEADLCGADLHGANLRGARLIEANLRGANLRRANLRRANLHGANLHGAIGVLPLPVAESRAYRWVAVWQEDGWRIAAGDRWFTITEARAHWGSSIYDGPRSVKETVGFALDWLEQQPIPGV